MAEKKKTERKRPEQQVHTDPGDNTKYLAHSLSMWKWPKPDMTDDEAVENRVEEYFTLCAKDDMKPCVSGLALAFGISRKTLWKWIHGLECKFITDSVRDILKKAYNILTVQMECYMQNGKINPVAGIFLMKNNMDYKDQAQVVLTPSNQLGDSATPEELQEKYVAAVGDSDDVEYITDSSDSGDSETDDFVTLDD